MVHVRSVLGSAKVAAAVMAFAVGKGVAQAPDSSAVDKLDSSAVAALEKMGAYLRTLNAFQVHATVSTEDVLDDGQKVQTTRVVDLLAQRPNRMFVEIAEARQPRMFYYDGKTFTLWAPTPRFYATVDAPPTILELVTKLDEKYDIDVPFVDLFRWGTPESDLRELTSATDVGPSAIQGVTCEQYLFRQAGLDWQIWIQNGEFPLPRKLVITTLTDDARPQHEAIYTWNLGPSFNDKSFAFTPPADAKRITIAEVQAHGLAKVEKVQKESAKSPEEPRKPRNEQ
jgi:hypothetical protein